MKKFIFITVFMLILLSLAMTVSAHECRYDFFDFENYVGNDKTLAVTPNAGTYGSWGINNRIGTDGNDGVTSAQTEKGTSMVLVRRNAQYPGVYYSHKSASYDTTETLHTSFSVKITGSVTEGYSTFRFRKRGSTSPYNIIVFQDGRTLSILGETIKVNGAKVYYQKNVWYDIDVVYDVPSGYCKVHITDGNGFDIYREGCSGYEGSLTSIQNVMFETVGSKNEQHIEAKIYFDDWKIETTKRLYVQKTANDFSDFTASSVGTKIPNGYMLTGFLAKKSDSLAYAGVFTEETEKGQSLVLAENTDKPLTLWSSFKSYISGGTVFETDLRLSGNDSDVNIALGDSTKYADAVKIEAKTGNVYAFGNYVGCALVPGKWYNIKLFYDTSTAHGYISISDSESSVVKAFSGDEILFKKLFKYKLGLSNYGSHSTNVMKAYFDNISFYGCDNIYHSYYEKINDVIINSDSNPEISLSTPKDIFGTKHFEFTFTPTAETLSTVNIGLDDGNNKNPLFSFDMSALTVTNSLGESVAFTKDTLCKVSIDVSGNSVSATVSDETVAILTLAAELEDLGEDVLAYITNPSEDMSILNVNSAISAIKHEFDISEYVQESENTFLVRMNNPIDWNDSFVARVNRNATSAEMVDAYTVRITYPMDPGEANIKLAGITDVYGTTVNALCELDKKEMPGGFKISTPVFFAVQDGIVTETDSLRPGTVTAITDIKEAY